MEKQRRIGVIGWSAIACILALAPIVVHSVASAWSTPVVTRMADPLMLESDGRPDGYAPGRPIMLLSTDDRLTRCTLGPALPDGVAWLTAGHCGDGRAAVAAGVDAHGWMNAGSFTTDEDGLVDIGVVEPGAFTHGQQSAMPFGLPVADLREPLVGESVCMAGSTTGMSCGWEVISVDARHATADGKHTQGALAVGRTDACVSPGDSGGPVFAVGARGASVVGVVVASAVSPAMGPLAPETCAVVFTTPGQASTSLG